MNINQQTKWSENVIIVDADFVDHVAFDLIVNFERMIGRRIQPADTAKWIDSIALDGGIRPGSHETQVVFIHKKTTHTLDNFKPGDLETSLNGKAFKDNLGEFLISTFPVEDELVKSEDFFVDIVQTAANSGDVKRLMVVPDTDNAALYEMIQRALRNADEDKHITVFSMQPMPGGNFRQEILGYSLMNALGIRADEIKE